jgi:hypothetical protein
LGLEVADLKQLRNLVYVNLLTVPFVLRIVTAAARTVLVHGTVPTLEKVLVVVKYPMVKLSERP